MLIAGVDEAGRGPAVGPMVMSIAVIDKQDEDKLIELGVKDSKLLPVKERDRQYKELGNILKHSATSHIPAEEIDSLRVRKSLNEIEAMKIGFLLNELKQKPEIVYIDSPDPVMEGFAGRIKKYLNFKTMLRSEHKADMNYPIVSAASVIAKVERDAEIQKLEKKFGKIGSGYTHDPDTIKFLKSYVSKNKKLPNCVRKSWITSQRVLDEEFQQKII